MQETYGSCDSCLRLLEKYSEEEVPEKQDLTGILHSYQGNCAVQNRRFEVALKYHKIDLSIGEEKYVFGQIQPHINILHNFESICNRTHQLFIVSIQVVLYYVCYATRYLILAKGKSHLAIGFHFLHFSPE